MGYGSHMDGCGTCMKYSMFIINFIIFLGGITVVSLGVWTVVDQSFMNELLGTNMYIGVVYVLIATGILVSVISCFGCFGSAREVRCMLVTVRINGAAMTAPLQGHTNASMPKRMLLYLLQYFIFVFLIFVTMLVGGILGYVFRAKVETTLKNEMIGSIRNYGNDRRVTEAWDETQSRLHCCGVLDYRDWHDKIPDSCCREPVPGKRQRCNLLVETQNSFTLFNKGCYNVTADYVRKNAAIIGGAGIIVAALMLLGMIFSCALYKLIE